MVLMRRLFTGIEDETVAESLDDIQGSTNKSSMDGRSHGLTDRHRRMRFSHSGLTLLLNLMLASMIWASRSNGISPQTMSYNNIPKDQTVAGIAWYLLCFIHSGGE